MALFIGLELFTNNVLEPWLYGSSTGLSPLAIIVAAVFWTTLWGPVGLLLATPLTVCLVVLGRHVPQLQFFEVLLGDQPVLAPEVKFYQRLLAGDPHEAEELAEDLLEEQPLAGGAGRGRAAGLAVRRPGPPARRARAGPGAGGGRGGHHDRRRSGRAARARAAAPAADVAAGHRVLCVGARYGLDTAAAAMLAQLLRQRGLTVEVMDAGTLLHGGGRPEPFDAVCLSYLDAGAARQARRLLLRVRARLGRGTPACVCLWGVGTESRRRARR